MITSEVILLLSGGIDSTTLLAELTAAGNRIHALSFDYGQRHSVELEYAARNASSYEVEAHHILKVDFAPMAEGNLLTGNITEASRTSANPNYVPGRNLLMLSHAAAYAEAKGISDIYFAANADDGQLFPDCTPGFINCLNRLWQTCPNTAGIKLICPFVTMNKVKVIEKSYFLRVDLQQTMSCYKPNGKEACGQCMSCSIREKAINDYKQTAG